ncbi:MAG TPA: bifunctional (p)ppGpp synthetase/guanosine-3',5'-bis(diphosphate) 3'-pyrophosphohydrolase [Caldisericia bacterium]|nr:bifunctional (p)ppGpp synthetase/guanosine-3',5'-bis(diphosphate) 3'-pyrophosphohydrolase [Caldisericia bacterium]HQL67103.1 bifunctional (p)ppGpp synthetase/guanosine-3',5'-bis(diphosphate) 3'-pyrophosphohydrolase [Caldisericia bacterium]HQN48313.1 bifunctional (p)ppGpp synthetase/guanosine-3',5'-bis(diphosphate) 3'-pyrophosphohydrolase [Caldisericia bacterium]HQO99332.1 bifunctional (p)ppGpp synthetase/guanosine-3',5'-bis(diphosphate) 3'-pyrophosphohydrolase [Caldisericia bacterium]
MEYSKEIYQSEDELWYLFKEKAKEKFNDSELSIVDDIYQFAKKAHEGQIRASNEPYILHPINVALILLTFDVDLQTIEASLLHDVVEDTSVSLDTIKDKFGKEVALLVDGVSKISQIKFLSLEEWKLESLRKVLIAMASDFRVVFIKLADRLHNMRTLNYLPEEKRREIAKETIEIYVPLAHRLGIYTLKWELEDLAFKYLEPEIFQDLKIKVSKKREERENEIFDIKIKIENLLNENNITCRVEGRAKNLYSIYRKMKQDNKTFDEIFDLTALRVIVPTIQDCYKTLGIVHTKWKPIPGRIKDYIAIPKPNGYQSLHTTLIGDNGEPFEIQIRTEEMHKNCEYGIASHWSYREKGKKINPDMSNKINWIRQIVEWQKTIPSAREFINRVKEDIFSDEIFVFTPKGEIINLTVDATPIDFAYKIHTEIGNKCIGAKVNGRIVPLNYKLKTGDRVEILTSKTSPGPSRDWLKFVKSSSTKEKIRQFYRKKEKEEEKKEETVKEEIEKKNKGVILERKIKTSNKFGVVIPEIKGEVLLTLAKCCTPIPGDEIIGYISKGRGVVVHRRDCKNLLSILGNVDNSLEKIVKVEWANNVKILYPVKINIHIKDEPGVLNKIVSIIAKYNYNIESVNAPPSRNKEKTTTIYMTLQIPGYGKLNDLLEEIKIVPNVLEIERNS